MKKNKVLFHNLYWMETFLDLPLIEIQADKSRIDLWFFTSKVISLMIKMLGNLFEECQQFFLKLKYTSKCLVTDFFFD